MTRIAFLFMMALYLSMMEAYRITEKKFHAQLFQTFNDRFDKKYLSNAEYKFRAQLYNKKLDEIEEFNKENFEWQKGETNFTDMTDSEKKQYLGSLINQDDTTEIENEEELFLKLAQEEENYGISPLFSPFLQNNLPSAFLSLPRKVNWLTSGLMTPVKNQRSCASCWAFTAIALLESLYKKKYGYDLNLSVQELVDCATSGIYNNFGCQGGYVRNALNFIRDRGSSLESKYPYTARDGKCRNLSSYSYKIRQVIPVKNKSLVELLRALSQGPVGVSIYVANDFYDYKSGIYNHKAGCKGQTSVNHAVVAVGYDLNSAKPHIIFKNSWGTNFGENGYFRMSMDLIEIGDGPCNLLKFNSSFMASL